MVKENKVTRTENVIRNTWIGVIMQFLVLIVSFINRTIFIKMLGNDYLSINGLFSNIINTLSFIELGFGTTLLYMLYKPVAEQNKEKIKTFINYYKRMYSIIGLTMFLLGILVIPFMKYIIKEPPVISENLNFIYLLFLLSTCISYFFAHKSAIINTHQQNHIVTIYSQLSKIIQSILQVIFLLVTRNFVIYLVIQILSNLINNILISKKANKMYPYLKEKNIKNITKEERKTISNKIKSLIFYRLNPAILNGSDNLIMSACIGISAVGKYSNYFLITNYLNIFIRQITSSFETSVGNLNASDDAVQKEKVLYKLLYVCFLIYGIICVLLFSCLNDFIRIWLGEYYIFSNFIVFSILLYMFIEGMQFPVYSYRSTTGLFEKAKIIPLFEIIINIVVSVVLAKYIGVAGVFLGTSIAKLLTFFWSDPRILYKYLFNNNNVIIYFKKYIYYLFVTLVIGTIIFKISNLIVVTNYLLWFIKSSLLGILTICLFILFTFKMIEYKEIKYIVLNLFSKIKNKLKK